MRLCPTAISASRADRSSRRRPSRRSPRRRRSPTDLTTRARCSSGRGVRPIASARPIANDQAARMANQRRAAARPLGDGQGAAGRPRLYLRAAHRLSRPAGRLRARAGHALQHRLPRPSDRHAAASCATARSPTPTAPSRRSTIMRRTSRLSDVGGRAQARGAPQARRAGDDLPTRVRRDHVSRQARGLGARLHRQARAHHGLKTSRRGEACIRMQDLQLRWIGRR